MARLAAHRHRAGDAAQHAEQRQQQVALALPVEPAEPHDLAAAGGERNAVQPRSPTTGSALPAPARDARCGRVSAGRRCGCRARSSSARCRRGCAHPWRRSGCGGRCGTPSRCPPAPRSRACDARCTAAPNPDRAARAGRRRLFPRRPRSSAEVASSRISSLGLRPKALAISTICRRDSGRLRTSISGLMSSQPTRASSASACRRWARRSISPKPPGWPGDADIVRDRQIRHQRQFLKDADDAERVGGLRIGQDDRVSVQRDVALVGLHHAGDDLDQRRLAGAVLAQHGVDRVLPAGEVHSLQRAHPAVALADAGQRQEGDVTGHKSGSAPRKRHWFCWLCAMICGAVNVMPQGGKALSEKNCSFSSGK